MKRYGSKAATDSFVTQLRRENQELKNTINLEKDFEKFIKDNDLECNYQWDRFQWEVKVTRTWLNDCWCIVKYHENKSKAVSMAFAELKAKFPKFDKGQLKFNF